MTTSLADRLRHVLAEAADPERAPGMQRYMKSEMPCRGVPASVWRGLVRHAIAADPPRDRTGWEATVLDLFDHAAFREERYAALAVLRHRSGAGWLDSSAAPLLAHLIVTGAWWDIVDEASICVGLALTRDRAAMTQVVRTWAADDNLWLRRAAIICQRTAREQTDLDLLTYAIEGSIADPDFFARKGIGWALREHSKTDEGWVTAFVDGHPGLAPLSRREALAWLKRRQAP